MNSNDKHMILRADRALIVTLSRKKNLMPIKINTSKAHDSAVYDKARELWDYVCMECRQD
jgi:hypothetical protein